MLCQEKPKTWYLLVSGFIAENPHLTCRASELFSVIYDLVFSMGNIWLFLRQVLVNASSKGKIKNENSAASKGIMLELQIFQCDKAN